MTTPTTADQLEHDVEVNSSTRVQYRESTHNINFHWIHGLEEYLTYIKHPQLKKYQSIKKAILYGNAWKIRELLEDEIYRGPIEHTEEFTKLLMGNYIGFEYSDHRKVLRYISYCIDDAFIRKISAWSIKWQAQANLNDHFSRGQIKSKLWLISTLKQLLNEGKIVKSDLSNIAHYGGWYATIAHFMFSEFNTNQYYNIELDSSCLEIADDFNSEQVYNNWKFKSIPLDVNDIHWYNNTFRAATYNSNNQIVNLEVKPTMIINTSCEHMNQDWFNNLPAGTLVCLQTNDYFENPQHINCVSTIGEASAAYKFSELYYAGMIETEIYNRFMLIGKK
jgi:hypothetical protein